MVWRFSLSFTLYRIVVLPAASSPSIRMRAGLSAPNAAKASYIRLRKRPIFAISRIVKVEWNVSACHQSWTMAIWRDCGIATSYGTRRQSWWTEKKANRWLSQSVIKLCLLSHLEDVSARYESSATALWRNYLMKSTLCEKREKPPCINKRKEHVVRGNYHSVAILRDQPTSDVDGKRGENEIQIVVTPLSHRVVVWKQENRTLEPSDEVARKSRVSVMLRLQSILRSSKCMFLSRSDVSPQFRSVRMK